MILSEGKLRLESTSELSVVAALENLLDVTAVLLERASGGWGVDETAGEKLVMLDGGALMAVEATPEPEDVIDDEDEGGEDAVNGVEDRGGEDVSDGGEDEGDGVAAAVTPRARGRPKKLTKTYGKLKSVTKASTGRPRGRPPKSAAARVSDGGAATPKRGPGRPRKYPV